jgi:hypothetical protein
LASKGIQAAGEDLVIADAGFWELFEHGRCNAISNVVDRHGAKCRAAMI